MLSIQRMPDDQGVQIELRAGHQRFQTGLLIALIGLLDAGQIEYRTVGTHRRVKAASLIRYLREDDARRTAATDALAAGTRELGFA